MRGGFATVAAMLYTVAMLVVLASAPLVFAALMILPAPYGRYATPKWGPTIGARAGWLAMELPALCVIPLAALWGGFGITPYALILLGLWEFHYVYRTLVFPFLIRDSGKRMPVAVVAMAVIFNSLNGYANGRSLAGGTPPLGAGAVSDLRFAAGLCAFACGFCIHVWADSRLRRLRRPGETGYSIPRGGLFEAVTCPNYFGEVLEWFGWALAAWSWAGAAFAFFTAANLVPRADAYRKWYRARFPEYPRERKRIIPFVY